MTTALPFVLKAIGYRWGKPAIAATMGASDGVGIIGREKMKQHSHSSSYLPSILLCCILALLSFPGFAEAAPDAANQEAEIDSEASHEPSPLKRGLVNISIRGVLSSVDVLGAEAPEEFRAYDVAATFRLPWGWYAPSGWGAGIRLMPGVGVLSGGGDTGLVVSLIPLLALGSRDGRFSLDMGAGAALLSRTTFGTQDFGGRFQFALTAGIGVPLFKGLGAGYRFMHYSDAAVHGPGTTGADLHMLEITCRF